MIKDVIIHEIGKAMDYIMIKDISLIEFVNPVFHITHFQPLQGYACAPNTPG